MLLPNDIVSETEDSQRTDAEIAAILREEDPEFYRLFHESMIKAFEPMKIDHWRHWKRRTLATNAVVVNKESEGYIRFAVTSVDYDLMMLNAVVDAFVVRLFGRLAPGTTPAQGIYAAWPGEPCICHPPGGAPYGKTRPERCYASGEEAVRMGAGRRSGSGTMVRQLVQGLIPWTWWFVGVPPVDGRQFRGATPTIMLAAALRTGAGGILEDKRSDPTGWAVHGRRSTTRKPPTLAPKALLATAALACRDATHWVPPLPVARSCASSSRRPPAEATG
jgi:hypothetical protein